jgi:hypothetical protein
MIRPSFSGQQPERMLSDPKPVLYREVRRKPGVGQGGLIHVPSPPDQPATERKKAILGAVAVDDDGSPPQVGAIRLRVQLLQALLEAD